MARATTPPPASTGYPHIEPDERGVLRIAGTDYKALELLAWYRGQHWLEEEFLAGFPGLTKAQFHSLLAYYYDHQPEIDREVDRRLAQAQQLRSQVEDPQRAAQLRDRARRARTPAT